MGSSVSKDVSNRLVISYGSTDSIFKFLNPYEKLRCQALNKWLYDMGVGRCQYSWKLRKRFFYFSFPGSALFKQTLFVFDAKLEQGYEVSNAIFDF